MDTAGTGDTAGEHFVAMVNAATDSRDYALMGRIKSMFAIRRCVTKPGFQAVCHVCEGSGVRPGGRTRSRALPDGDEAHLWFAERLAHRHPDVLDALEGAARATLASRSRAWDDALAAVTPPAGPRPG